MKSESISCIFLFFFSLVSFRFFSILSLSRYYQVIDEYLFSWEEVANEN